MAPFIPVHNVMGISLFEQIKPLTVNGESEVLIAPGRKKNKLTNIQFRRDYQYINAKTIKLLNT